MKIDALNRRSRIMGRQPRGDSIQPGPRDEQICAFFDRHGKVPSGYIHRHVGGERTALLDRLNKLYHGVMVDSVHVFYLDWDPAQKRTPRVLSHQKVYHLSERGKAFVDRLGIGRKYGVDRNDHFLHQLYGSCLSASFELTYAERFLHFDALLERNACPQETRDLKYPLVMPLNEGHYVPDNLFGLSYEDGSKRYFMVEVDRGTEPSRTSSKRPSIEKKLRANVEVLERQLYRRHFGIGNVSFLYATVAVDDMRRILKDIRELVPEKWQHKFFVQANAMFSTDDWRVPTGLLPVREWMTMNGPADISIKAPQ